MCYRNMKQAIPLAIVSATLVLGGCAATPPSRPDDVCSVLREKSGWHRATRRAERRWNIDAPIMLAFMHKESSFIHNARPPRKRFLGIPTRRPSSAFGYAQATDETWSDYQRATGDWRADRDDFGDAIDFVGWYLDRAHRQLNIPRDDARNLYIAYHDGLTGYKNGHWRKNTWLKGAADRVVTTSGRFRTQLARCSL